MTHEQVKKTLAELYAMGLAVEFVDWAGVERIRLTPDGARHLGEEKLAKSLEDCAAGRHLAAASYLDWVTRGDYSGVCPCGEVKLCRT